MKTLILILFPLMLSAQSLIQVGLTGLNFAVAGGFESVIQADHFYPDQVQRAIPGYRLAKDTYGNKYKNGDPAQGPAFWGSTTIFVAMTDDFHRFQMGRNLCLATSFWPMLLKKKHNWWEYYRPYDKKPWWAYVTEVGVYSASFGIGKEIGFGYIKSK